MSNFLNQLFGKSQTPIKKDDPQSRDQHDSAAEQTQPGKEIPVQIDRVGYLEIVFEIPTPGKAEQDLLTSQRQFIVQACWPGFIEALSEFDPNIPFGVNFAVDEEKAIAASVKKATARSWNLMIQPQAAVIAHPTKGKCRYKFLVNVFLEADQPDKAKSTVFVAQNHRLIPALGPESILLKALRNAQSREEIIQAGEAVWAEGERGLLYILRWCYPRAAEASQAVGPLLNKLLICPSKNQDQFLKLFMLVWCGEDEELAKLGVALVALQHKYGNFNDFSPPEARAAAREIGQKASEIGSIKAMQKLYKAVEKIIGTDAAYGLTFAWNKVGGWCA